MLFQVVGLRTALVDIHTDLVTFHLCVMDKHRHIGKDSVPNDVGQARIFRVKIRQADRRAIVCQADIDGPALRVGKCDHFLGNIVCDHAFDSIRSVSCNEVPSLAFFIE